ncbi:retrovirus-related pol polyprotein from transposon TNT 1-94 [Tanacetum coccineum]
MHNNIMVAGSKDRPPMLAMGRYEQWRSHEIYSTVDACKTTNEMWIAIKRLQQGESLNIQDVKTNLFWEFGKFTSRDGESMEPYYSWFYKMMNEMIRNNLQVATMQQYQNEVNEIRAERIAKSANPLALVAAAQQYPETYHQAPKPQRSYAPAPKQSFSTRSNASTRHKGKEIAKPVTPLSELESKEDSDPEQAQKDKEMQKFLALIENYFKKLYKPTNNNLKNSSNSRNKNVDNSPRYVKDNQTGQFRNQMTVALGRLKPKRVKDYMYHKEKMLLCKQAEKGVPLQTERADWLEDTDEEIDEQELEAHYSYMAKIQEVLHADSDITTEPLEEDDSNVTPDSSNMCNNDNQVDQNAAECDDERVALANLIENLKLDTELEKYIAFNDRTIDYDKLERKLNETLGLLAQKDIDIKDGLKLKAYEISVVKQKHDELVKQSLLSKSSFEGLLKEKSKVISDFKVKEGKDIDKMIAMEKQLKFLNEIVYKRNQSIKTIYMLAPKCSIYNGRPTFANPMYLKKAQAEKLCLYEIPYDTSDLANIFAPDWEETIALEKESRSKLDKDFVKPYDYTKQNSLYEIFKPPSQDHLDQLARAKEVRKKMWRKSFVKSKPNIVKNIAFLPVSKSISKSRQAYNEMTNNMNNFREIVDNAWVKHTSDRFRAPTALDMEVLIKTCLMPLWMKTQNDSFTFVHELKKEMHEDFKYVESLEKEIEELKSDKADFSNMYDLLLQEFKECECLALKLSKQTENVSKEVHHKLLKSFSQLEQHSISLELALQQCQEQMKNDTLKKLIEKGKGKSVETQFDKPSVVRQPNAQRILKPSVLGKPTPFSNSLERRSFSQKESVNKTNVSDGSSKKVTTQILPQKTRKAVGNTNVIKPGMYRIVTSTTQTRTPQLPQTSRNANHCVSTFIGVTHITSVSKPQLKSTQVKDKAVQNISQVKFKKNELEDHHMISSISNKTKSVTACNDSLKSRTLNVNAVCATCGNIVQLVLFIVDSGCTKHMTGNLKLPCNFVEKFMGTIHFGNDQFAPILGYGDLIQGNITIKRVYYVEGLNHNLFSVGQFCDADLEVAFRKSTCYVRDLQGNNLLTGNRGSDLYTISLQESTSSTPICFMAKASPTQAWLWHQKLSHLNFDYINLLLKKDVVIGLPKLKFVKDQLCSSCEVSKAKKKLIQDKRCSKF